MAKLPTFSASSYDNLCDQLSKINLSAPLRGQARSKDHKETWSICRFLASYGDSTFIKYPLKVEHKERPDIRLFMPSISVGVEITDAIDQQRAHHDAIVNRHGSTGLTDASLFKYGHPEYSKEEIRRMAIQPATKLNGPGWEGDEPEQAWAKAIMDRIKAKVQSVSKAGFQKFDKNWLIIYDNTVEQILELDSIDQYLWEETKTIKRQGSQLPVEYIFIEHQRIFLKIADKGISCDKIVDLWS